MVSDNRHLDIHAHDHHCKFTPASLNQYSLARKGPVRLVWGSYLYEELLVILLCLGPGKMTPGPRAQGERGGEVGLLMEAIHLISLLVSVAAGGLEVGVEFISLALSRACCLWLRLPCGMHCSCPPCSTQDLLSSHWSIHSHRYSHWEEIKSLESVVVDFPAHFNLSLSLSLTPHLSFMPRLSLSPYCTSNLADWISVPLTRGFFLTATFVGAQNFLNRVILFLFISFSPSVWAPNRILSPFQTDLSMNIHSVRHSGSVNVVERQ